MSNTSIQTVHSDVTITYNERDNKWEFTLRGRDRSYPTLAQAKEFIDKPVPKEKSKPFEKIPAWHFDYGDGPVKVVVTGIAEIDYARRQCVWINKKGTRSKEPVTEVFPQNEKNDAIAAATIEKRAAAEKLSKEVYALQHTLSPLMLPKDEE